MKTSKLIFAGVLATVLLVQVIARAQRNPAPPPKAPAAPEPPPVSVAPPQTPPSGKAYIYDQKPIAGRPVLVAPEQAQSVIDRFKAAYPKLGSPRMVVYVNRDLIDDKTGFKLIARTEKTERTEKSTDSDFQLDPNYKADSGGVNVSAGGNVTVTGDSRDIYPGRGKTSARQEKTINENRYRRDERKELSLADKQTVRDVERLFGRPLRMGGVRLADQRVATQLIADKPLQPLATEGEQARKDREALSKIADVAVEILISSKNIQVAGISGDKTYTVPDIQATAMRLKDARVMGQASSSDIIGKERYAGYYARNFDVREIAEATALALMEDMLTGVEPPEAPAKTAEPADTAK